MASKRFLKKLILLSILGIALTACTNGQPELPVTSANSQPDLSAVQDIQADTQPQPEPAALTRMDSAAPASDTASSSSLISLVDFANAVANGDPKTIRGIYIPEILALRVIQQPQGDPAYVSSMEGVVTQFSQAANQGVTGLLAHNFASGRHFFNIPLNAEISVIYGDGSIRAYQVSLIRQFQALQPDNPSSDFIDLETGQTLSASTVFQQIYSGDHHLTLQTCIQQGDEDSWGRIFIIAQPVDGTLHASLQ